MCGRPAWIIFAFGRNLFLQAPPRSGNLLREACANYFRSWFIWRDILACAQHPLLFVPGAAATAHWFKSYCQLKFMYSSSPESRIICISCYLHYSISLGPAILKTVLSNVYLNLKYLMHYLRCSYIAPFTFFLLGKKKSELQIEYLVRVQFG